MTNSGAINHSSKYKRFLITSSFSYIIARFLSIIYVYVINDIVKDITVFSDMILLATYQSLFIIIIPIGMGYTVTLWTLQSHTGTDEYQKLYSSFYFLFITPMTIIASIFTWIYFGKDIKSVNLLLYIIANLMSILMNVFASIENSRYNNHRSVLIASLYSLLNSILVPAIYYYSYQSLTGILLAWMIASSTIIIIFGKDKLSIFTIRPNIKKWFAMIKLAFPNYILSIVLIATSFGDRMFIYNYYGDYTLTTYYWVERILLIGSQMAIMFLTGINSMIILLHKENQKKFETISRSIFKSLTIISFSIFIVFFINAQLITEILFKGKYEHATPWLRILAFPFVLLSISEYLAIRYSSLEKRALLLFLRSVAISIRYIVAFSFVDKGINGLFYGIYSSLIFYFVSLVLFAKELRTWDRKALFHYLSFLITTLIVVILTKDILWPVSNIAIIIIFISAIIIKPLQPMDSDFILKIIPYKLKPLIQRLLHMISYTLQN